MTHERKPIAFRDIPRAALFEYAGELWRKVGARTARLHTASWYHGNKLFRAATKCRISDGERSAGKRSKTTH